MLPEESMVNQLSVVVIGSSQNISKARIRECPLIKYVFLSSKSSMEDFAIKTLILEDESCQLLVFILDQTVLNNSLSVQKIVKSAQVIRVFECWNTNIILNENEINPFHIMKSIIDNWILIEILNYIDAQYQIARLLTVETNAQNYFNLEIDLKEWYLSQLKVYSKEESRFHYFSFHEICFGFHLYINQGTLFSLFAGSKH